MQPIRNAILRRARIPAALLILLGIGLGAFAAVVGSATSELAQAEARWAARGFRNYRMELEDFGCIQEIEVRNDRIVWVNPEHICASDERAIGELFDLIRRNGTVGARCITQRCACDDRLSVLATYDAVLGYPREIEVRIKTQPNWQHRDYWEYFLRHGYPPSCDYMEGNKRIAVLSLEPLP